MKDEQNQRKRSGHIRKLFSFLHSFYNAYKAPILSFLAVFMVFGAYLLGATGTLQLPGFTTVKNTDPEFTPYLKKIVFLENLIDEDFHGEFDREKLTDAASDALFEALGDPYTDYYSKTEFSQMQELLTGTFSGIGVVLDFSEPGRVLITNPTPEGPAEKAGIQAGDVLIKVDGADVSGLEYEEILALTSGENGTQVEITVLRDGSEKNFTVTRGAVNSQTVYSWMMGDIGYIYLQEFGQGSASEFKKAVEKLESDGAKGLVIDLRYDGGGMLTTAVEIADYLLPEGSLGYLEDNEGKSENYESEEGAVSLPYVVLINGQSASASEFLSGNLQAFGATVVGTTSFGKGVAQTFAGLPDGTGFKITTEEYFIGDGSSINKKGVVPDLTVESSADIVRGTAQDETEDAQLARALELLRSGQAGKPEPLGESTP